MHINMMQENLERLEELNSVMRRMAALERTPVSESCQRLIEFTKAGQDPLLFAAHASASPYMKKGSSRRRFLCC